MLRFNAGNHIAELNTKLQSYSYRTYALAKKSPKIGVLRTPIFGISFTEPRKFCPIKPLTESRTPRYKLSQHLKIEKL